MSATSHNRVADAVHTKLKRDAGSSPGREIRELAKRTAPYGTSTRKTKTINAPPPSSSSGGGEDMAKKTYKLGAFTTRSVEVTLLKCPHCGYSWETHSRMANVTCPNCARKVRVK